MYLFYNQAMTKLKKMFLLVVFLTVGFSLSAQKTKMDNVFKYTLDNGLTLYVVENPIVPLTYIEIAFRGGSSAQTADNAGLFHLYEHMMFKGNEKFTTAAALSKGIKDLGVSSWNGSTSLEHINYFFTVPSDLTREGLEFWAYAVRKPLFDEKELENEKKVVISEIEGLYPDSNNISWNSIFKNLFPDAGYKLDPAGPVKNIEKATVSDLRKMQSEYYIPNNTALFVGGNVKHEEVYKLVKELYGSWEKGDNPWKDTKKLNPNPLSKPKYIVIPDKTISSQYANIQLVYRGCDCFDDQKNTYVSDVCFDLLNSPSAKLKNKIIQNPEYMIPMSDYIYFSYPTMARLGYITIGAMMLSPENNMAQRAVDFSTEINGGALAEIAEDSSYFSKEEMSMIKQRIENSNILGTETTSELIQSLRYWWICADDNYYFSYADNMKKVNYNDISSFLNKYLINKNPLVVVIINPDVYKNTKNEFDKLGFEEISENNAYWWKEK